MFFVNRMMLGLSRRPANTAAAGHAVFNTNLTRFNTTRWTVPAGVWTISLLGIGQGGTSSNEFYTNPATGGGGGHLRWKNSVPVTPGEVLEFAWGGGSQIHGDAGWTTTVTRVSTGELLLLGLAGSGGRFPNSPPSKADFGLQPDGSFLGGGNGGLGAVGSTSTWAGGGGGAGGYSGDGGDGGRNSVGTAGSGGGGSGGNANATSATSGGGVGLGGQGANGAAGSGTDGGGGSGGGNRASAPGTSVAPNTAPAYGAGGGAVDVSNQNAAFQYGGPGAARVLWHQGEDNDNNPNRRAFPATRVASASA